MNAKFLKKVFYNRKSRRGFKYPKRPAKRTNFNNIRRKINYNFNNRTQTYGPGSTVLNLTGNLNWDMTELHFNFAELVSTVVALDEYKKFADDYQYVKILGIGVTIYPNDALNNIPTYIDLDWGGNQMTENDILGSDRAKIIYNDLKNKKTFYYRPPDVITHESFNPRKYNLISNFEFSSIYLSIQQDGGLLKGRVDIRMSFRGPLTKLNQFCLQPKSAVRLIDESRFVKKNNNKKDSNHQSKNENSKFKKEFNGINLKKEFSVDSGVSNLSFLKGLVEDGVSEEKIRNSKNYKKLSEKNKKKIKKLLNLRKKSTKLLKEQIEKYKENRKKNKKQKKKENKEKKNKNKNNKKNEDDDNNKNEDSKLSDEDEKESKEIETKNYLSMMAREQDRVFSNYYNLEDELKKDKKELEEYENIFKNMKDAKNIEEFKEILEIKKKKISDIEKKLKEADEEVSEFQRKAGVSEDEDD